MRFGKQIFSIFVVLSCFIAKGRPAANFETDAKPGVFHRVNRTGEGVPIATSELPDKSQTTQSNQWTNIGPAPVTGVFLVDPTNPSVLYLGGIQLWKFNGVAWTNIRKNIHVDQQSMAWAGNRLIVGNDGGVFSTTDGGATWRSHNTNLSITQFYKGSLHPRNPYFILAGSEDNGNDIWTGSNTWQDVLLGDGADNAISSERPDTDWAVSSFNAQIFRTIDGGKTFSRLGSSAPIAAW